MIYRYPRYGELFDAWQAQRDSRRASAFRRAGFPRSADVVAAGLVRRGVPGRTIPRSANWSQRDAISRLPTSAAWAKSSARLSARCMPVYRKLAAAGQIEISTTPYYHPILPLLCDSNIASVAHPDVPLPPRFRYPEDARRQLAMARDVLQRDVRRGAGGALAFGGLGFRRSLRHRGGTRIPLDSHRQRRARPHAGPRDRRGRHSTAPINGGRTRTAIRRDLPRSLSERSDRLRLFRNGRRRSRGRFPASHPRKLRAASWPAAAMPWCPSFSMAKTPGNITIAMDGRSCASCTARITADPQMSAITVARRCE